MGSIWVSIVAVAISLFALGWQITRSQWERPVIIVTGTVAAVAGPNNPQGHQELHIGVTNVGERAVTVITVGWVTARVIDPPSVNYITLNTGDLPFPVRIEPHDSRSWVITRAHSEATTTNEPYAIVIQRPTWWEGRQGTLPKRTIYGQLDDSLDEPLQPPPSARRGFVTRLFSWRRK